MSVKGNALVRVGKSSIHGRGVFARQRIAPGVEIIEFAGRRKKWSAISSFADEEGYTALMWIRRDTVIDPSEEGNCARLINHSCDPNCEALIDRGKVFIYSLCDIEVGCELTMDYKLYVSRNPTREEVRAYPCYCGVGECRGTLFKKTAA